MKIAVISNITLNPFFSDYFLMNFKNVSSVSFIPYEERYNIENKEKLTLSDLIVVWINLEIMIPDYWNLSFIGQEEFENTTNSLLHVVNELYSYLKEYSDMNIVWFTFEDYYRQSSKVMGCKFDISVDLLNIQLKELLKEKITFIDTKRLIAEIGIDNAYDLKNKYRWNIVYSKSLIESAVENIYKMNCIESGITKKCLILDCDNVLWGGIVSEDGIENIKLGKTGEGASYQEFQRFVLELYYKGVILAICSKNDLSDILTIFDEHSEMILKKNHISCFQVNWDNKPDNIRKLSRLLNISLDSMVFVDDSIVETQSVNAILPEVTTITYNRYTIYNNLKCFNLKGDTCSKDIEHRNATYQTNELRETLKLQCKNYDEYVKALNIQTNIHLATSLEIARISELTQRTNKFSNGKRYSISELKKHFLQSNIKIYSITACDRFSDLGIIGACEICDTTLTLFSFSCRALGRGIEDTFLKYIFERNIITGFYFSSTGKNEKLKKLLLEYFPDASVN